MAGRKRFAVEEILDRAMRVFWARGYEATSLHNLTEATGLNKSSLYNAFGGKEQLFERALKRYESFFRRELETALSNSKIEKALSDFFEAFIKQAGNSDNPRGCLITSSCNEFEVIPAQISEKVCSSSLDLVNMLAERLEQAQIDKELDAQIAPLPLARYLVATLKGMAVMDKVHNDVQVLEDVKSVILKMLQPHFKKAQTAA